MKMHYFFNKALFSFVIILLPFLFGCESTLIQGPVVHAPIGAVALNTMVNGEPCYFRGKIDFCAKREAEPPARCPEMVKAVKVDEKGCPLDTDGDGVIDDLDQCPNTPQGAWVNELGCWVLENLHFQFDKQEIEPDSYPLLDRVVKVLLNNVLVRVEIQGHTDNMGTHAYNEKLSKGRADAVMNYLISHGIAADRLTTRGFGLTQPVASNEDAEGRAKNRRVELHPDVSPKSACLGSGCQVE